MGAESLVAVGGGEEGLVKRPEHALVGLRAHRVWEAGSAGNVSPFPAPSGPSLALPASALTGKEMGPEGRAGQGEAGRLQHLLGRLRRPGSRCGASVCRRIARWAG